MEVFPVIAAEASPDRDGAKVVLESWPAETALALSWLTSDGAPGLVALLVDAAEGVDAAVGVDAVVGVTEVVGGGLEGGAEDAARATA